MLPQLTQAVITSTVFDPWIILLQERHVEQRDVGIDEFENESLHQQGLIVVRLSAMVFSVSQSTSDIFPAPIHELSICIRMIKNIRTQPYF
jgi:hypothetical protein